MESKSSATAARKLSTVPQRSSPSPRPAMGPSFFAEVTGSLWRMYADRQYNSWKKTFLWDMVEPYRRPKSFTPLVSIYVSAFYTAVIGAAITEQLYKEKYWEDHPGEAVPLMKPKFYFGPWRVMGGEVPPSL